MTASLAEQVERDFAPWGGLGKRLANYAFRAEQVRLAADIAAVLEAGTNMLAEAATGTGKTLAYLLPALRSDRKIIICTHTKALQDQLMQRDLPLAEAAIGVKRKTALLKGRLNYLCPQRLHRHLQSHRLDGERRGLLAQVTAWAEKSPDGDFAGLAFDPFACGIGGMISANADQCLGRKCAFWDSCPLVRARSRAMAADIVVANHSLLLADAALKAGDFGEVLPAADAYILDEAHALPDTAAQIFGLRMTRHRFVHWANDMQAELDALGDEAAARSELAHLMAQVLDAFAAAGPEATLAPWCEVCTLAGARAERSEELAKLHERAGDIESDLERWLKPPAGFVAWAEGQGVERRFLMAPVDTGACLGRELWRRQAVFILLSATLRVSDSFAYSQARLGLEAAMQGVYASPFAYAEQALIYLPRHLPAPGQQNYERDLADEIEALARCSTGRAFVLFASHQGLRRLAPQLRERLPWRVLIQGMDGSKEAMLDAFRADTHSVLCGTRGFWEGVDVPGEALSMVIIDKLPFAPPDDPLLKARLAACEAAGGNGFTDIQLPEAIAVLRQGMGRLIRTATDRGVMALLDSRIHRRSYGVEVLRNLPPAPISHDIEAVRRFFPQT